MATRTQITKPNNFSNLSSTCRRSLSCWSGKDWHILHLLRPCWLFKGQPVAHLQVVVGRSSLLLLLLLFRLYFRTDLNIMGCCKKYPRVIINTTTCHAMLCHVTHTPNNIKLAMLLFGRQLTIQTGHLVGDKM